METGNWVNLTRSPAREPRLKNNHGSRSKSFESGDQGIKVHETTPRQGRVGVNKSRRTEVQVLRSQVASLAKEKQELAIGVAKGEELLNGAKQELQTSLEVSSHAKQEMEDQRRIVHRLSTDNARLIRQVESLWQHSPELKSPSGSLSNHLSTSSSPYDHTHSNGVLVKDLERLSQRATELSQALASTQQSRTALEREVLSLKRSQLDMQNTRTQLEEALAKSEEERAILYQHLQESEDNGRRRSEQFQLHMEATVAEKTDKLEELLSLSERLQSALSTITREKTTLEHSLREEVTNRQQMTIEKQELEMRVTELETRLEQTRYELTHMQDHQLQEVTEMKTILETEMMSLQKERDELSHQVECEIEEKETLEREIEATRAELINAETEVERLSDEVYTLQTTLTHSEKDRATELSLLTAQIAEITACYEGIDRERKEQENRHKDQVDGLTNQLRESGIHANQLEAEAKQLQQLLDMTSHDLKVKSRDLDSAHSELHASKMTTANLEQQVSDLDARVLALNEQIVGRTELTNEMRALLEQRADQIQELESIVTQQREEIISTASHTHLLSDDSTHILQATPIRSSRPLSPEPHSLTTPPNDITRLRKQLSESRDRVLKFEASCEEIRTDLAKQQGSVHALTIIKDKLSEENSSLQDAKRRAEEGRRSAEDGRKRAEEGRKALSRQLSSLQGLVTKLKSEITELRGEREEAMSQISELQEAYADREAELAEELAEMEVQSIAASESGEVERDYLQLELAKSRAQNTELEQHVLNTEHVIEQEYGELQNDVDKCTADLSTLRSDDIQVQEECRLAAAINAKQTNHITEKEGCVSGLLGEVEVLRARKAVMMKWLCQDSDDDKSLRLELESIREELQQCQAANFADISSLTQQLEQERLVREREREVLLGQSVVSEGGERRRGCRTEGGSGACKRAERLRARLKSQVEQSNYLRVKLGYTLKELQLYKDLKAQLDSQITQQAIEMNSLQDHYTHCLKQLQHVERLGFQATVLPNDTISTHL